jgi:hypothetical protein
LWPRVTHSFSHSRQGHKIYLNGSLPLVF